MQSKSKHQQAFLVETNKLTLNFFMKMQRLRIVKGFPGGAVVKNPPANAGDMDSSPGPGRSHMPWSN